MQILSAVVAATLADMDTGATDAPDDICLAGAMRSKDTRDRAPRICYLGMATSIISVFTALTLIQLDMIAICTPGLVSVNIYIASMDVYIPWQPAVMHAFPTFMQ